MGNHSLLSGTKSRYAHLKRLFVGVLAGLVLSSFWTPLARAASADPAELSDTPAISIGSVSVEYARDWSGNPKIPSIQSILALPINLNRSTEGDVSTSSAGFPIRITLSQLSGSQALVSPYAIRQVEQQIQEFIGSKGINAVFVYPKGLDLKSPPTGGTASPQDLDFVIVIGVVTQVRTVASGYGVSPTGGIDEDVDARIRNNSPVQPVDGKNLVQKDAIDGYVAQINRQPGRQVEAAISSAGGAANDQVDLDYLVHRIKPWYIYAEASNTGTAGTNAVRERFGVTDNDLTGHDDIANLDFNTASSINDYVATGYYDIPLTSDDRVRFKVYGQYEQFVASDLGIQNTDINGLGWTGGGEFSLNVLQCHQFFLDAFGGARVDGFHSTQTVSGFSSSGQAQLVVPYAGLRIVRDTAVQSTHAEIQFDASTSNESTAGGFESFGRTNVSRQFQILHGTLTESLYLDPFLHSDFNEPNSGHTGLINELVFSARGQYSFNSRLIPEYELTAGGLYSVRGYKESIIAGDSVAIASLEYRFHIPPAFGIGEAGTVGGRPYSLLGRDFQFQPALPYGEADWDLYPCVFTDAAIVSAVNGIAEGDNFNQEYLWSAGAGITFRFRDNFTVSGYYGVVLNPVDVVGEQRGDGRLGIDVTLLY